MTPSRGPDDGPTRVRGTWIALAILVAAAVVFAVLIITSGALGG